MVWTDEMVLEFIQNYETEPVIWNPKNVCNKKKNLVADAWHRLKRNLSFGNSTSVEELKKKKDSLMAYYRFHLNKIKNSIEPSKGAEEIYKTNWFAFSSMHRFLAPVYECTTTIITEKIHEYQAISGQSNDTDEGESSLSTCSHNSQTGIKRKKKKRRHGAPDLLVVKKQSEACATNDKISQNPDPAHECHLYAQLLAQKLKKLDEERRLILMHEIDNLVFQALMTAKSDEYIT